MELTSLALPRNDFLPLTGGWKQECHVGLLLRAQTLNFFAPFRSTGSSSPVRGRGRLGAAAWPTVTDWIGFHQGCGGRLKVKGTARSPRDGSASRSGLREGLSDLSHSGVRAEGKAAVKGMVLL